MRLTHAHHILSAQTFETQTQDLSLNITVTMPVLIHKPYVQQKTTQLKTTQCRLWHSQTQKLLKHLLDDQSKDDLGTFKSFKPKTQVPTIKPKTHESNLKLIAYWFSREVEALGLGKETQTDTHTPPETH